MPQTLGEIRQLLKDYGLMPKKRFGQNFLHDANKIKQIMDAAHLQPKQVVLEIGSGTGTLSKEILDAGAKLIAVEVDSDLIPILSKIFEPFDDEQVTLLEDDIFGQKRQLAASVREALGDQPFTVVANLPYNIASPLLAHLALDFAQMKQAIVMVQKEVADRMVALPGNKDYGPLGIIVQALCEVKTVTTLSPNCFWPKPKINSSVICLTRREKPLVTDPHAFAAFVHLIFNQRRKQLGRILGRDIAWPDGIEPNWRPEVLTLEQIEALRSCLI